MTTTYSTFQKTMGVLGNAISPLDEGGAARNMLVGQASVFGPAVAIGAYADSQEQTGTYWTEKAFQSAGLVAAVGLMASTQHSKMLLDAARGNADLVKMGKGGILGMAIATAGASAMLMDEDSSLLAQFATNVAAGTVGGAIGAYAGSPKYALEAFSRKSSRFTDAMASVRSSFSKKSNTH